MELAFRNPKLWSACVATLAMLIAVVNCSVYDPGLVEPCSSKQPPARPTTTDSADGSELVFALKDVVFEQLGDAWRDIGYDLDGRCSTRQNDDVECRPPSGPIAEDGNNGIDNIFGKTLYAATESAIPGTSLQVSSNQHMTAGDGAVLLRIRSYNGTANDPNVDVMGSTTVFATPGMADGSPPAIMLTDPPTTPGGALLPVPEWSGNDYFWLRDDGFLGADIEQPFLHDNSAYVRDNILVFRMPERTDIIFPGTDVGVLVRLTDGILTGRLSDDLQRLESVTVAGRWAITDLLDTAETLGVCRGSGQYDVLQLVLAGTQDVRSRPGSGGAGVTCDAISMGITLIGYAAKIGGLASGPAIANSCADGGLPDGGLPDGGLPDAGIADVGGP